MSLISSVAGAAATLVAGLDSIATASNRPAGLLTAVADGLVGARKPDALTAKLATSTTAAAKKATAAARAATTKATTAAKASAASKASTAAKASAASKATTAKKATTASSGYSTAVAGDDMAFLKDATLSVEEKLFRFMCAIAKRNDDEVLKKMEEMKGGTAAKASGSSGTSSGSTPAKKSTGTSVWGALKALVPPLGLAAQLVGDAKLKSMITQVSGPVLAAAATALGLPALAPMALKAGPELASALMNGKVGGEAAAAVGGSSPSSTSGASSSSSTSTAATGKNEQVQMMELQRLVDKQKEMFAMISNVLRAQHDTRMSIIGNVR